MNGLRFTVLKLRPLAKLLTLWPLITVTVCGGTLLVVMWLVMSGLRLYGVMKGWGALWYKLPLPLW